MNKLNTYLVVICVCLSLTYGTVIFANKHGFELMVPQLIMLIFTALSVATAMVSKKWFGQLLF